MNIYADLQIHSKYSRAVSSKMNIEEIYRWARIKGIGLVATGDWTHPLWFREIQEKLQETGRGTLKLSMPIQKSIEQDYFNFTTEFLLATEISSIYTQRGKVRRVHNLVWVPSISSAKKVIQELEKRGCNISSDGRPIVGLSSKELLELVLTLDEQALVIPAHVWTPWFALFGSKSGFDSIHECFEDLAKYIYAIETGLSSDPKMNWRIKELDTRSIVSFSDAHSGPKLGREATVFKLSSFDYMSIREAIMRKKNSPNRIAYTIEFYPEEGKYHYDGHRNCKVRQSPETTRKRGILCPVCARPLTVGVEFRVDEIAQRDEVLPIKKIDSNGVLWNYHPQNVHPPYTNLVPLAEIISEVQGVGVSSKKVQEKYNMLIKSSGPEFHILLKENLETIEKLTDKRLSDAIKRVRKGMIVVEPGFDGEFGKVKVFADKEQPLVDETKKQMELF